HPVRAAAWPTVSDSIRKNLNRAMSGLRSAFPSVLVLEPDHVLQLRRRDLEDRRVLEGAHAMDGSGREAKGRAGTDDLGLQHRLPCPTELKLGAAAEDVPALVLLAVELKTERLAGAHEEQLPRVALRLGPDQLVPPRLFDLVRLERKGLEALEIRRGQRPLHGW